MLNSVSWPAAIFSAQNIFKNFVLLLLLLSQTLAIKNFFELFPQHDSRSREHSPLGKHHSLYGWSPVLQVWIQLLCLWWMNNSFTCLVKTKPVKQEVNHTVILAQSREHSLLGEVSLHGWSPFLQVLAQLFHYIIITTYLIFWSNQILLNRRRAVQWSSPCCKCSTVCHDRK